MLFEAPRASSSVDALPWRDAKSKSSPIEIVSDRIRNRIQNSNLDICEMATRQCVSKLLPPSGTSTAPRASETTAAPMHDHIDVNTTESIYLKYI